MSSEICACAAAPVQSSPAIANPIIFTFMVSSLCVDFLVSMEAFDGIRSYRQCDSIVPGVGAAVEAVADDTNAVNGCKTKGVRASDHLVALRLQLACDAMSDP